MPNRCCIRKCNGNNSQGEKVPIFRFPSQNLEPEERIFWIEAVQKYNENFIIKSDKTFICENHWPDQYDKISKNGKERPKNPPSIFVEKLIVSKDSTNDVLDGKDELSVFEVQDKFDYDSLVRDASTNISVKVITYICNEKFYVQSMNFIQGIPMFVLILLPSLKYEAFHCGIKVFVSTISINRGTLINRWSILSEAIRFLDSKVVEDKTGVLMEHVNVMSKTKFATKVYPVETVVRAFEYFATSRALYNRLRDDYKLPAVKTLTRITSKVAKVSNNNFLKSVFDSLEERKKLCIILFDEIYVKKMMTYHGGTIFGKALNYPDLLATTVLGIMINCMFGGPTFLSSMIPVTKLNSPFLGEHIMKTIGNVNESSGDVKVLVCDDNRVNQKFYKGFSTRPGKPWLSKDNLFLLFDYVHIVKNIRNNWVTELSGEIKYSFDGKTRLANWHHLISLYKAESLSYGGCLHLSKLNESAVMPKHTEKQSVPRCLRVFCDETATALVTHPSTKDIKGVTDTSFFIKLVVKFWKIVNVKRKGNDIRNNDILKSVIRSADDPRLDFLISFGSMCLAMKSKPKERVKQLTRDTALAAYQTSHGMVDLTRHLLNSSHEYVTLGEYSTDKLEKAFSKLRQGSGGTYFITVQQILEKVNIKRANLLLNIADIENLKTEEGHYCQDCSFTMDENTAEVFDNLPLLEEFLIIDTKMSLVYIAGYVTRKDGEIGEDELLSVTTFYHQKFGSFTDGVDRGMLNIPNDRACQWTFFSYILFSSIKQKVCQKSLSTALDNIASHYSFNMSKLHSRTLSNIFLNNHCIASTPRSSKESQQKVLKLS